MTATADRPARPVLRDQAEPRVPPARARPVRQYDLNVADDNQQKNVMQSQFTMFWNDKNVAGITIWGYIVGSTWVTNSGLMTSSGTMRPAMTWLMGFLSR